MAPRKLKIYLDASVISRLEEPDKASEYEHTRLFLSDIGKYDVYTSESVARELAKFEDEKAAKLFGHISDVQCAMLADTDEIHTLADRIVKRKILPPKSIDDARRIAHALMVECDYLLSWNMNRLANVHANDGARLLAFDLMLKPILMMPPSMLVNNEAPDMKKPEISKDFTLEDIRKIRDYAYHRQQEIGAEAYEKETQPDYERGIAILERLKAAKQGGVK
jgi:hypothetical protein